MPDGPRPHRESTAVCNQLRLLVTSPKQAIYEMLRPIVLFGQPILRRARETGIPERTMRHRVDRFEARGMRRLFAHLMDPLPIRWRLLAGMRQAIAALPAEYPAFGVCKIASIC